MLKQWKAASSLLAGGLAAAAFAMPGAAQAAEIGQVCNAGADWVVYQTPGNGGFLDYIFYGDGFRITGFAGDYYQGHKNGGATGYLQRWVINQATCHW